MQKVQGQGKVGEIWNFGEKESGNFIKKKKKQLRHIFECWVLLFNKDHYVSILGNVRTFRQNILNKSENATPDLCAIYIQNYANQECNGKCILMF